MALATVFMLSSGFVVNEPSQVTKEDFDKICRYRFVSSDGETIAVYDVAVPDSQSCTDNFMIENAWGEYTSDLKFLNW
jgi:hypothetical protein